MPKVVLLKIFEDVKIRYRARTARGSYLQEFEVVKRPNPEPITLEKLAEYVTNLNQRFPDREFYLDEKVIDGKKFIVLSQRAKPKKAIEKLEKEIAKAREKRDSIFAEIQKISSEIDDVRARKNEIANKLKWIAESPLLLKALLKPLERYLERKHKQLRELHRKLAKRYSKLSKMMIELSDKIRELEIELIRIKRSGIAGRIPLYFEIKDGKLSGDVYVPKSVWEKKRKNASY
ncbi:hypothetical protein DRN86_04995, partial [Candidatus Geothermarchaeota archaeon]